MARRARRAALRTRVLLVARSRRACVAALAAAQRGISLCQSLLRAQLGQRVNVMILEKALTLELAHFEDSRVLRQADARAARGLEPAAVARHAHLRPRAERDLAGRATARCSSSSRRGPSPCCVLAGLPAFVAEARSRATPSGCFAGARPRRACRSTSRRCSRAKTTPRRSSSSASGRCSSAATATSSRKLYGEDRDLTIRRDAWGFAARPDRARARSTAPTPGSRSRRSPARITLGADDDVPDAVPAGTGGGLGEPRRDRRHVRGQPLPRRRSTSTSSTPVGVADRARRRAGPSPEDGIRFEDVSFTYPGAETPALTTSTCTSARAARSRWSARTAPARPR